MITDNTTNSIELNIDPALYIEGNERWLYWGSWGAARRVKLKDDLIHLDGAVETVTASGFFEAPWVHKFNGNYYFSYASGYPSTTNYAMSSILKGPWNAKGVINTIQVNSETNHQAIIQFRGNWLFIYHQGNLNNGGTYKRAVNIEYLYYTSEGAIVPIIRTNEGVRSVDNQPIKDAVYRIKADHSNLFLEDSNGVIQQAAYSNDNRQHWEIVRKDTTHSYALKNLGSGKYLSLLGDTLLARWGNQLLTQNITIENASVAEGYYIFSDYSKDRVMDILNISTDAGIPAISWVRTGRGNQKFHFEFVREIGSTMLTRTTQPENEYADYVKFRFDLKGRFLPE